MFFEGTDNLGETVVDDEEYLVPSASTSTFEVVPADEAQSGKGHSSTAGCCTRVFDAIKTFGGKAFACWTRYNKKYHLSTIIKICLAISLTLSIHSAKKEITETRESMSALEATLLSVQQDVDKFSKQAALLSEDIARVSNRTQQAQVFIEELVAVAQDANSQAQNATSQVSAVKSQVATLKNSTGQATFAVFQLQGSVSLITNQTQQTLSELESLNSSFVGLTATLEEASRNVNALQGSVSSALTGFKLRFQGVSTKLLIQFQAVQACFSGNERIPDSVTLFAAVDPSVMMWLGRDLCFIPVNSYTSIGCGFGFPGYLPKIAVSCDFKTIYVEKAQRESDDEISHRFVNNGTHFYPDRQTWEVFMSSIPPPSSSHFDPCTRSNPLLIGGVPLTVISDLSDCGL
eukprot:m.2128 g.2128  ORF g.2128 m.2128 type:complete len:404 (-) comp1547_c0_seq1:159-1370(-)